jgi:hypothetical protein
MIIQPCKVCSRRPCCNIFLLLLLLLLLFLKLLGCLLLLHPHLYALHAAVDVTWHHFVSHLTNTRYKDILKLCTATSSTGMTVNSCQQWAPKCHCWPASSMQKLQDLLQLLALLCWDLLCCLCTGAEAVAAHS